MTLFAAGALAWLGLGLAFWLLHLLRPPLPRIVVPALLPWQWSVPSPRRRLARWLLRHLPLILQLLAMALLATALAAPIVSRFISLAPVTVTIAQPGLDPTPLRDALSELTGQEHVLLLTSQQPKIAYRGPDPEALLATLARADVTAAGGDLTAVLGAAGGLIAGRQPASVVILADGAGAIEFGADERWRALAPTLPNTLTITTLTARPASDGSLAVLYRLSGPPGTNYDLRLEPRPAPSPEAAAAGAATLPGPAARPGGRGQIPPSGKLTGTERIASAGDEIWLWALGSDGEVIASAVVAGRPTTPNSSVLVDAEFGEPWRRAAQAAGFAVTESPAEEFDIAVYLGRVPDRLPAAGIVLVDPPPVAGLTDRAESAFSIPIADPAARLLGDLPLGALAPQAVDALLVPAGAAAEAHGLGGAILWRGRLAGRQVVALAVDPALHLAGQAEFPLLAARLLAEVDPNSPLAPGTILRPGQATFLRTSPSADSLVVYGDSGQQLLATAVSIARVAAPSALASGDTTPAVAWIPPSAGRFLIIQSSGGEVVDATYVYADPIGPAPPPTWSTEQLQLAAGPTILALWPHLAVLALALLLFEWFWFHRRRGAA